MTESNQKQALGELVKQFVAVLPAGERMASQAELNRFVRWFGWDKVITSITPAEVANYVERLSTSDLDYTKKLEPVRALLMYAKKKGLTRTNMAVHLRAKRTAQQSQPGARRNSPETTALTREGYTRLEAELAGLREKRLETIEEIRRAAADKDFRENAPLHAAREQCSKLEGRILELEETLKSASIIDGGGSDSHVIAVGDNVTLQNLNSGQEIRYKLVGISEVDPSQGKISGASPIGKALLGHRPGEAVEVVTPAGRIQYRIEAVRR